MNLGHYSFLHKGSLVQAVSIPDGISFVPLCLRGHFSKIRHIIKIYPEKAMMIPPKMTSANIIPTTVSKLELLDRIRERSFTWVSKSSLSVIWPSGFFNSDIG